MKIKDIKLGSVILVDLNMRLNFMGVNRRIPGAGGIHSGIYVGKGRYVSFEDNQIKMGELHKFTGKDNSKSSPVYVELKDTDDTDISDMALAMFDYNADRPGVPRNRMTIGSMTSPEEYSVIFNNCHTFSHLCSREKQDGYSRINRSKVLAKDRSWDVFQSDEEYLHAIALPKPEHNDKKRINGLLKTLSYYPTPTTITMVWGIMAEAFTGLPATWSEVLEKDHLFDLCRLNTDVVNDLDEIRSHTRDSKYLDKFGFSDTISHGELKKHIDASYERVYDIRKSHIKKLSNKLKWDRRKEAASDVMSMLNPLNLFRDPVYA